MTEKTYKRETALVLFSFLGVVFAYAVWQENALARQVGEFLTLPVFTFGAGAFAIDAVFKRRPVK